MMVTILPRCLKSLFIISVILYVSFFIVHGSSPAFEDTSSDIDVFTLDNGLKVIIYQKKDAPYAAIQILVGAGSVTEGKYAGSGISHFIEHLLFKGTENRDWDEIARTIESYGGYFNASTSFDFTLYYVTVGNEYVVSTLEILADMIQNPRFDPEHIEQERSVILKEINMGKDNPQSFLSETFWKTAYRTHPYRYPVIGYEQRLKNLSREDILDYYQKQYCLENCILVVAGDVERNELKTRIKNYFSGSENLGYTSLYIPQEPPQLGKRRDVIYKEIKLGRLLYGFHTTDVSDEDMYALDVLAHLLGAGRDSRLNQKIKEDLGIAFSIQASNYTPKHPGMLIVNARYDPAKEQEVVNAVTAEIEKIKQQYVLDEELQKVKNAVIAGYIFGLEKIEQKARVFLTSLFYTGNVFFDKYYVKKIQSITKDDILLVAKKYLVDANTTIVFMRPSQEIQESVVSFSEEETPVIKEKLKNGLTVLLKEDKTLPIVVIRAVMEGGLLAESAEDNGISRLFAQTWTKGTPVMTQKDIASSIENVGGDLGAYSGKNSLGITVKILKEHFDIGMDLFFSILENAHFPEGELLKEKEVLKAAYRSQKEHPMSVGQIAIKKMLFPRHPYGMNPIGDPDHIDGLTQKQVQDYYHHFRNAGNMVIGVWGDIDSARVSEIIKEKTAFLKTSQRVSLHKSQEPLKKSLTKRIQRKDQKQTVLFLGFRGTDMFSKDRYVLAVISMLMSGQGSTLFEKVRERLGMSYFVGASSDAGLDPGTFIVYAGTVPEKENEVLDLFFEELERLKKGEIREDELKRAKNMIIWQRKKSIASLSAHSFTVMLNELYGLGYNYDKKEEALISSVSLDDIKNVSNTYFTDAHAIVIVEPEKEINGNEHYKKEE